MLSPCACLHVHPCLHVSFSPSTCLALNNCSGCLMATCASTCICIFLLSYTFLHICLPAPVCISARVRTSPSAGFSYHGEQGRHVHPRWVCPSRLELCLLRAKTRHGEEQKSCRKRPRGQLTFWLPMFCSHGKDPEIRLLVKIMAGCLWNCKTPSWRITTAFIHPLSKERARVSRGCRLSGANGG